MLRRAREVNAPSDMIRFAIMRGLRPVLQPYVMQQNPKSTAALLEAAKVAEATVVDMTPSITTDILDAIRRLEDRVVAPLSEPRRVQFREQSPPPRQSSPVPVSSSRRQSCMPISFGRGGRQVRSGRPPPATSPMRDNSWFPPPGRFGRPPLTGSPQLESSQLSSLTPTARWSPIHAPQPNNFQQGCTNCGRVHAYDQCFARGKLSLLRQA